MTAAEIAETGSVLFAPFVWGGMILASRDPEFYVALGIAGLVLAVAFLEPALVYAPLFAFLAYALARPAPKRAR